MSGPAALVPNDPGCVGSASPGVLAEVAAATASAVVRGERRPPGPTARRGDRLGLAETRTTSCAGSLDDSTRTADG